MAGLLLTDPASDVYLADDMPFVIPTSMGILGNRRAMVAVLGDNRDPSIVAAAFLTGCVFQPFADHSEARS